MNAPGKFAKVILISGSVQGIGFRPSVYRWASACEVNGYVANTHAGVEVHIEGTAESLSRFMNKLRQHLPAAAKIESWQVQTANFMHLQGFTIAPSRGSSASSAVIPVDRVHCESCLRELFDPTNRRYLHPFISCAECGPRFSILRSMPYDRENTSLVEFSICAKCRTEYEDPHDRRFHAQTISCRECGPQLHLLSRDGSMLHSSADAIIMAANILNEGGILAVKGIGGYQLLSNAYNREAVMRIRKYKSRPEKALAIMLRNIAMAKELAFVNQIESKWLCAPENPIVLLRQLCSHRFTPTLTPHLATIGILLPSSPIHALLLAQVDFPVMVTSANREAEPIIFSDKVATHDLAEIAEGWLLHNRNIEQPLDDSVLQVIRQETMMLRLARGFAPFRLEMTSFPQHHTIIATGGEQKSSFAIGNRRQAILSAHIGDLSEVATIHRWQEQHQQYEILLGTQHTMVVHDAHPDYFTTRWCEQQEVPSIAVQHHEAHVAASMLAHGYLDREVLGFAWDGTGWGTDGTVWGGEMFCGTAQRFEHIAQMRPFNLLGGEKGIHEPWRCAVSILNQCELDIASSLQHLKINSDSLQQSLLILERSSHSTITSSVGRIFDAAASIILGRTHVTYEGQAALELEHACDLEEPGVYPIAWLQVGAMLHFDWRPLFQALITDQLKGYAPSGMAMKFHRTLANVVIDLSDRYSELPVVLGGGVFQNAILVSLIVADCESKSRTCLFAGMIPPGDGGLAAGQLALAAMRNHSQ